MSLGVGGATSPHNTTAPGKGSFSCTSSSLNRHTTTSDSMTAVASSAAYYLDSLEDQGTTGTMQSSIVEEQTTTTTAVGVALSSRPSSHLYIPLPPTPVGHPLHYALTGSVTVAVELLTTSASSSTTLPQRISDIVGEDMRYIEFSRQTSALNATDVARDLNGELPNDSSGKNMGDYESASSTVFGILGPNSKFGEGRHHRSHSLAENPVMPAVLSDTSMASSVYERAGDRNDISTLPDLVYSSSVERSNNLQSKRSNSNISLAESLFKHPSSTSLSNMSTSTTYASDTSFRLHPEKADRISSNIPEKLFITSDVGGAVFDDSCVPNDKRETGQQLLFKLEEDLREFEKLMYGSLRHNVDRDRSPDPVSEIIMEEERSNDSDANTVKSMETNYSFDSLDDDSDAEDGQGSKENLGQDESDYDCNSVFEDQAHAHKEQNRSSKVRSVSKSGNGDKLEVPTTLPSEKRTRQKWQQSSLASEPTSPSCSSLINVCTVRKSSNQTPTRRKKSSVSRTRSESGITRSDSNHSDLQTPTNPPFFSVLSPTASEPPYPFDMYIDGNEPIKRNSSIGVLKKRQVTKTPSTSSSVEKHCSFSFDTSSPSPSSPQPQSTPSTPSTPKVAAKVAFAQSELSNEFQSHRLTSQTNYRHSKNSCSNLNQSDSYCSCLSNKHGSTGRSEANSSCVVEKNSYSTGDCHSGRVGNRDYISATGRKTTARLLDTSSTVAATSAAVPGRAHRILLANILALHHHRHHRHQVTPTATKPQQIHRKMHGDHVLLTDRCLLDVIASCTCINCTCATGTAYISVAALCLHRFIMNTSRFIMLLLQIILDHCSMYIYVIDFTSIYKYLLHYLCTVVYIIFLLPL